MKTYRTVDEYIKAVPADFLPHLRKMRALTRKLVPQGTEVIKYGMPTVQVEEKNFIHYAAMKGHLGLYPSPSGVKAFEAKLKKQEIDFSKGCIRFPYTNPLPIPLITKIISFRLKEERLKARDVKNN